jgi:hypothetical protein
MKSRKETLVELAITFWRAAILEGEQAGAVTSAGIEGMGIALAERLEEMGAPVAAKAWREWGGTQDGMVMAIGITQWADAGFPQVEMSHKFAAALLLSDVMPDALDAVRPPWRGFMIEVPDALLEIFDPTLGRAVPVRRILVTRWEYDGGEWAYIAITSAQVTMYRFGMTAQQLLPRADDPNLPQYGEEITDADGRVGALLGRLVINTCLSLSSPELTKETGPGHAAWSRAAAQPAKMGGQVRTFKVGRPVAIDLRERVREYVRGERHKVEVRSMIRGHFRRQHHGEGNRLVKVIWVEPFWRGPEDAAVVVRPHVLKDSPPSTDEGG